mmetsp:Transcript_25729/g.58547  ORF Transcript_25729/g.58547 Transcript_25729/m.58547 type:complete len:262 (+) Transcript_25729:585-1370(+)
MVPVLASAAASPSATEADRASVRFENSRPSWPTTTRSNVRRLSNVFRITPGRTPSNSRWKPYLLPTRRSVCSLRWPSRPVAGASFSGSSVSSRADSSCRFCPWHRFTSASAFPKATLALATSFSLALMADAELRSDFLLVLIASLSSVNLASASDCAARRAARSCSTPSTWACASSNAVCNDSWMVSAASLSSGPSDSGSLMRRPPVSRLIRPSASGRPSGRSRTASSLFSIARHVLEERLDVGCLAGLFFTEGVVFFTVE